MYDTPTGHAVRESLQMIAARHATPSDAAKQVLQARVCAAVDELKEMGWPIESIIARLKELADDVGLPLRDANGGNRAPIVAEIVRVSIDRYYAS